MPKSKNLGSPPPAPPGTPEKSPTSYSRRAFSTLKGTIPSLGPALNQSLNAWLNRTEKVNKSAPDLSPIKDEAESSLDFSNPGLSSTLTGPPNNDAFILGETNEVEVFERTQADYNQLEQSDVEKEVIEVSDHVYKIDTVVSAMTIWFTFVGGYFWTVFKNAATKMFNAMTFSAMFVTILSYGFAVDFILTPIWNALPENLFSLLALPFSQPWIWIFNKLTEFQEKFTLNGVTDYFSTIITPIWNALKLASIFSLLALPFSQPWIWILNKLTEFQEKFTSNGIMYYFSTKFISNIIEMLIYNFDVFFQNIRKTK